MSQYRLFFNDFYDLSGLLYYSSVSDGDFMDLCISVVDLSFDYCYNDCRDHYIQQRNGICFTRIGQTWEV